MRWFVLVYFWLLLIASLIRIIYLGGSNYPRSISRHEDALALPIQIGLLVWAAYLLWVQ